MAYTKAQRDAKTKQTKVEPNINEIPADNVVEKKSIIKAIKTKPDLPLNMMVDVKNGFHGRLIYISKKTGDELVWDEFGDEQVMELQELKYARASQKKFFLNNWWIIDDPDVIEYLNVEEFYKYAINSEDYDDIFTKPLEELDQIISELTPGQKKSMGYRVIELINNGDLDSRKTIEFLKKALGFDLIEE